MTLIIADGFDHWGTGAVALNNMLLGTYSSISSSFFTVSSSGARTGNCLVLNSGSNATSYNGSPFSYTSFLSHLPFPLVTGVGLGMAIYMNNSPGSYNYYTNYSQNSCHRIPSFIDANNNEMCMFYITQSNQLACVIYGTVAFTTAGPVIPNASYCYFEAQVYTSVGGGNITVNAVARINGSVVINTSGFVATSATMPQRSNLTTAIPVSASIGSVELGFAVAAAGATAGLPGNIIFVDDFCLITLAGTYNNTWIGDRRCRTLMPSSDTTQADWTKSSGTVGYSLINEIPQDGDTTYIQASAAGNKSNFGFQAVPANTADIAGVCNYYIAKKSDAGPCNLQSAIIANSSTANGNSQPITTAYNYYRDIIERDGTGVQFTQTTLNAGLLSLVRVV